MSTDFEKRVNKRYEEYKKDYNVDSLNASNDRALLFILIRSELLLEDVQNEMHELISSDAPVRDQIGEMKKMSDLIKDLTDRVGSVQKTLNIDRRSRKNDEATTIDKYITTLKQAGKEFLENRMIKIWCPDCKVMVGRIAPVHEHTMFSASIQCSQCKKMIRAQRNERDVFFDVKDADWRRKYKAEIIQPDKKATADSVTEYLDNIEDTVIINTQENLTPEVSTKKVKPVPRVKEGLEL